MDIPGAAGSIVRSREGFALAGDEQPILLLVGTFPGVKSLDHRDESGHEIYYFDHKNKFWDACALAFFDMKVDLKYLAYEKKIEILKARGIAIWDIIKTCTRKGSLDSGIISVEKKNDIAGFCSACVTKPFVLILGRGKKHGKLQRELASELASSGITFQRVLSPSSRTSIKNIGTSWKKTIEEYGVKLRKA